MKRTRYLNWTKIKWDGNPALKLECWRKSFGRGHVSIGIGSFLLVGYSYGPNSNDSLSGTRWRSYGILTEHVAMAEVDVNNGKYKKDSYLTPLDNAAV